MKRSSSSNQDKQRFKKNPKNIPPFPRNSDITLHIQNILNGFDIALVCQNYLSSLVNEKIFFVIAAIRILKPAFNWHALHK